MLNDESGEWGGFCWKREMRRAERNKKCRSGDRHGWWNWGFVGSGFTDRRNNRQFGLSAEPNEGFVDSLLGTAVMKLNATHLERKQNARLSLQQTHTFTDAAHYILAIIATLVTSESCACVARNIGILHVFAYLGH
jgi:hypothetical protein